MKRKHLDFEEANVNLTPLIDVVFVILVMFIVVAPLLEIDRIDLADALSTQSESILRVEEQSPITIQVHSDNTLTFNKQVVTIDELKVHLEMAYHRNPLARPQLFQDRESTFGIYQTVKNVIEKTGFAELDVILKPS